MLSLFQHGVFADAGWTGYGRIAELQPTTAGRFLVRLETDPNPSDCRNKSWFYRDYGDAGVELMFHALLGALTSNLQARVFITGRCDLNGYSEISSASIVP